MEYQEFYQQIKEELSIVNLTEKEEQIKKLYLYMKTLIEENRKINLTAITEPTDIITKHFIDSLSICRYLEPKDCVIDVGTGAGFPGLPVAIMKEDINMTLLDTLKKRVDFLESIARTLEINNVITTWGRAEDIAHKQEYREVFDVAVSRAVAPLNVLLEYMLPFVKVGGKCICMKGPNIEEELNQIENALPLLGGKIEKIDKLNIKENMRSIVIIQKITHTNEQYPRKAGIPSKKPLV